MEHTKGPWKIGSVGYSNEQVFDANDNIVADCMFINRSTKECIGNTLLIAAAPMLLEACKNAVKVLDGGYNPAHIKAAT